MATLRFEDGQGARTLVVESRLSIQDAAELKQILLEALLSTDHLIIDMTGAESIDLACAQLVCAAHRTFQKAGKRVELAPSPSDGARAALSDMAIDPACCSAQLQATCIWKKGA